MKTIAANETGKFATLDYGKTWLKLGADRRHAGAPEGLILDAEDMKVLAQLLRMRVPVGMENGRAVYCEPAVDASPALAILAAWADAGAAWQERNVAEIHVH